MIQSNMALFKTQLYQRGLLILNKLVVTNRKRLPLLFFLLGWIISVNATTEGLPCLCHTLFGRFGSDRRSCYEGTIGANVQQMFFCTSNCGFKLDSFSLLTRHSAKVKVNYSI